MRDDHSRPYRPGQAGEGCQACAWGRGEHGAWCDLYFGTTREAEARRRQAAGQKPGASTGIHGYITYGYGELDEFGFWEYPLPDGEFVGI